MWKPPFSIGAGRRLESFAYWTKRKCGAALKDL